MMKVKDYTGVRFGMLTVLRPAYIKKGHKYYTCRCDCGNIKDISGSHLATGASKSCGCGVVRATIKRNTTHGLSKTRLFSIWMGMKRRCFNPNEPSYQYYGGRGITMCKEWKSDFMNFHDWSIENGYSDNLSIDRINADGNYEPTNCRWANAKEQASNKTNNHIVTINGVSKPIMEWCKEYSVTATTVYQRMRNGWNEIDAITKPDQRKSLRIR